jgi:hypothetical protein
MKHIVDVSFSQQLLHRKTKGQTKGLHPWMVTSPLGAKLKTGLRLLLGEPIRTSVSKHLSFLAELALKMECARKFCHDFVEIFGKEVYL